MELTDLPTRNPEGWAVVDLMGHRRIVGNVVLVRIGDIPMLEVEQPEIRVGQCKDIEACGDVDRTLIMLSHHKVIVHLQSIYVITPVPDVDHCINAFFESHSVFDVAENPGRWAPRATAEVAKARDDCPF